MNLHSFAYFISPHGFGHAARASAVMNALHNKLPGINFEIYTSVPEWFFRDSCIAPFNYHYLVCDVGLVQKTATIQDLDETLIRLAQLYPVHDSLRGKLKQELLEAKCCGIICDISPLGIEIADSIGIPSYLVENFTWDWIYEEYKTSHKGFSKYIKHLKRSFGKASYHIQTEPVCESSEKALFVPPISRLPKHSRSETRSSLEVYDNQKLVLITMGGVYDTINISPKIKSFKECVFILPGSNQTFLRENNVIYLSYHSNFYHPDLVSAADAVIGKAGYSTLAEIFYAAVPFGYVKRENFRESPILEKFIKDKMKGICIPKDDFETDKWLNRLDDILNIKLASRVQQRGNDLVADFVLDSLDIQLTG